MRTENAVTSSAPIRIDAHQHFWDPAVFDYPWMIGPQLDPIRRPFRPADLEAELASRSLDGSVLVQCLSSVAETRDFLRIARETPFVFGVVGWVDLTAPDVGDRLDELIAEGEGYLVGIRHQVHDELDLRWLSRPDVRRGLAEVQSRGLSYDLLVRAREMPSAVDAVSALPDGRFVLDHIGKPRIATGWDADWAAAIATLAARPNVQVKLSGMITEADWRNWRVADLAPYVEHVIALFGSDRVMLGSDWPVCLLAAPDYGHVIDAVSETLAGLSETERAGLFGENAAAFYGLTRNSGAPG
jgi:L-fuconolactonase